MATGTPTAGLFPKSIGVSSRPAWSALGPAGVGFSSGKDRDRPAANNGVTNQWGANDTYQSYWTDGTNWFNTMAGWDKATLESQAGGFSDTIYIASNVGTGMAPSFASGQTLVILFKVNSLPGTGGGVIATYSNGTTTGWFLANSTTVSNGLRVLMTGVNSTGNIQLTGITLTTGVHVLAINYTGSALNYSYDGGAVQTVAVSGTYTPPGAAAAFFVGKWSSSGVSANWFSFGFLQGYGSALSNGDLITAASNGANYLPGNVSSDPTFDWQARWVLSGAWGSGPATAGWGVQCYGTSKSKLTTWALFGGVVKLFQ
jgi:hypothetical protein